MAVPAQVVGISKCFKFYTVEFPINSSRERRFTLPFKYRICGEHQLGNGTFGCVWEAENILTNQHVAIKKIRDVFQLPVSAIKALREVRLQKILHQHKHITMLLDVYAPPNKKEFVDLYVVVEKMDFDLEFCLRPGNYETLEYSYFEEFMKHLLDGLAHIHSANIIHRDLKPGNLLLRGDNSGTTLKLGDFGLARVERTDKQTFWVQTMAYRAPEVYLNPKCYDKKIDIWSSGCIFAEMLTGQVLFQGFKNVEEHIHAMIKLLGTPTLRATEWIKNEQNRVWIHEIKEDGENFEEKFKKADKKALDLLKKMLQFDPEKRISAKEALNHPYFTRHMKKHINHTKGGERKHEYEEEEEEDTADVPVFDSTSFIFEDSECDLRGEIWDEVEQIHSLSSFRDKENTPEAKKKLNSFMETVIHAYRLSTIEPPPH